MEDNIAYLDTEVSIHTKKITKLGLLLNDKSITTQSIIEVKNLIEEYKPEFICGHNFIDHDKKYLSKENDFKPIFESIDIIDTLYLSMLLFPDILTHKLEKPYKTDINIENHPLEDSKQTQALLQELDSAFNALPNELKEIYVNLLNENEYFRGYFLFKGLERQDRDIISLMQQSDELKDKLHCTKERLKSIAKDFKAELAIILSFLYRNKSGYFSCIILNKFPCITSLIRELLFHKDSINLEGFVESEFGIEGFEFRDFKVAERNLFINKDISQKEIIEAALDDKSFMAILPTGGGKTLTFQLPALLKAKAYKALSVVISPLQALMRNHVSSFKDKNRNFKIEAINSDLNPIERADIIRQLRNGEIDILYIAPEALRSNSIFNALKSRFIDRFIIDEAHCFSAWGHDFRHDYYFIANIIQELEESPYQSKIAVSCFSATAKKEVIKDIKEYFKKKLDLELESFIASSQRDNLAYEVIEVDSKEKYHTLLQILIERFRSDNGKIQNPTIIYIPHNASLCKRLNESLKNEAAIQELGLIIEPFYSKLNDDRENGKPDEQARDKEKILQDFIDNEIDIVIATTAFGMGIDKPDITTIIHYEQSDSLESYMQESGRGARGKNRKAECIVLYDKDEFNKKFHQLNSSKIEYDEINAIAKALKALSKDKESFSVTQKEIAEAVGRDTQDPTIDYRKMINTALLELERHGIIKRGRNNTRIFATSITKDNGEPITMDYVRETLEEHKDWLERKYKKYKKERLIYEGIIRVMNNIIQRSKKDTIIEIEELADLVDIDRKDIFYIIYESQRLKFIGYGNDIEVSINDKKKIKDDLESFFALEKGILEHVKNHIINKQNKRIDLREIKPSINNKIKLAKNIISSWEALSNLNKDIRLSKSFDKDTCHFKEVDNMQSLESIINTRKELCEFIINNVLEKLGEKREIEFSSNQLKEVFDNKIESDAKERISLDFFHHTLAFLHDTLERFKITKGRLIYYTSLQIEKLKDENNEYKLSGKKKPYTKELYDKTLKPYYERKIESIHILTKFLQKVQKEGYESTKAMMLDYFIKDYNTFKKDYNFNKTLIKIPLTEEKYNEMLHNLDENQKEIVNDKESSSILVLAGPGSGKTKTLVHKIASLVTLEGHKAQYFLMLSHQKSAVADFRERIRKLIGNEVYEMNIFTFHAFALKLLGETIDTSNDDKESNNKLDDVLLRVTQKLNDKEITLPYIQMLVLDEYQDIGEKSYEFVKAIYSNMSEEKKIIAVGDDDQCIKNFGNDRAKIEYIKQFEEDFKGEAENADDKDAKAKKYFLLTNYRSTSNIVNLANGFRKEVINNKEGELKSSKELESNRKDKGDITLTYYTNSSFMQNMISEVKEEIKNDNIKSIALLFRTNEEVLLAHQLLLANNIEVKYIINKEGFDIGNLVELQDFLELLKHEDINQAHSKLKKEYENSSNYPLINKVIKNFRQILKSECKNYNDTNDDFLSKRFATFLKEITFDDFNDAANTNTKPHTDTKSIVIISTMHKAKGREFDSVFLGVEDNAIQNKDENNNVKENEYEKRLLYVALTRAKTNLHIHTKDKKLFDILKPDCTKQSSYNKTDEEPNRICFIMGLGDIRLTNYEKLTCHSNGNKKYSYICDSNGNRIDKVQENIESKKPLACESVLIKQELKHVYNNKPYYFFKIYKNDKIIAVLADAKDDKVSKKILNMQKKGYVLESTAIIEHICYWKDKDYKNTRHKEVLCRIYMSR